MATPSNWWKNWLPNHKSIERGHRCAHLCLLGLPGLLTMSNIENIMEVELSIFENRG